MSDKKVIKLSVPEHLRTGKVYEALKEQTMSKVYKQDPKLPQGKWIDENKSGPRSFQEVADAMYDTPEATPSPDTRIAFLEKEYGFDPHMDLNDWDTSKWGDAHQRAYGEYMARLDCRQSLTAAQAELDKCKKAYGKLFNENCALEGRVDELTAAQAEIQRLREELKIVVGICSSDTLPRKEGQ